MQYLLDSLESLVFRSNEISRLGSGAFQGLDTLQGLFLTRNRLTSLESGAFQGLINLQRLSLAANQITSLKSGAFQGLGNLQSLQLQGNPLTELNLAEATLPSLTNVQFNAALVTNLILDRATISAQTFHAILYQHPLFSRASLVGLTFADAPPLSLIRLLDIGSLAHVRVDPALYHRYAAELNAFAAKPGHTLTIVPEPTGLGLALAVAAIAAACRGRAARAKRPPGL